MLNLISRKVFVLLLFFITSCNSYKHIAYFQNLPDSNYYKPESLIMSDYDDPKIQSKDLLQITLKTLESATPIVPSSAPINVASSINPITGQFGTTDLSGYLVDDSGMVELPIIGKIRVAGLSTTEAKYLIQSLALKYYKDAVVNVRLSNFTITVLGEVNRPAQYIIPGEKINVLDAIGLAGDLTIYAKRNNVLLIREENNIKKFIRFNLNSSEIFSNPFFYLKPRDVLYIEPGKSKAAANDLAKARNITIASAAVSLLIMIFSRVSF